MQQNEANAMVYYASLGNLLAMRRLWDMFYPTGTFTQAVQKNPRFLLAIRKYADITDIYLQEADLSWGPNIGSFFKSTICTIWETL